MIENYINKLFCKDNLELLKELPNNSVDLIYSDILYATGRKFDDYQDLKINIKEKLVFDIIPETIYNHYWIRLIEMKRVLKNTGSIYLQMDTRINHWMRIMMDMVFGYNNFRNEIIRKAPQYINNESKYSYNHDIILFYTMSNKYTFNLNDIKIEYKESSLKRFARKRTAGKMNLKSTGINVGTIWDDVNMISNQFKNETIGYATQKPEKLLERIILASSNENDIVLDLYMGSGTSMVVAKKNNRKWIGVDINPKSIEITDLRLNDIEDKSKQIEQQNKLFEF
jgi:site-specific DNA-methyltransferase (adenine-specific)